MVARQGVHQVPIEGEPSTALPATDTIWTAMSQQAHGATADRDVGLSLEEFAALSAAIAEGDRSVPEILAARGLAAQAWREASLRFAHLLAEDDATAEAYTAAFTRNQDALRSVPALTPEEWADLVTEHATKGAAALARRGLRAADHLRLSRHWAKLLSVDHALAARYQKRWLAVQKG